MLNGKNRIVWLGMVAIAIVLAIAIYIPTRASIISSQDIKENINASMDPDLPRPVDDPTAEARKTVAAAGVKSYRETLPEWEGSFMIRESITDAMKSWIKDNVSNQVRDQEAHRVYAARSGIKWRYDEFRLSKDEKVESVYSTTWDGEQHRVYSQTATSQSAIIESSPKNRLYEEFYTIDQLLTVAGLEKFDFDTAYYAGTTELNGRSVECYARSTDTSWQAVWLDPERGYAPVKFIGGKHSPWTAAVRNEYSNWRQDEKGRWMPGRMVTRLRVPNQPELGKTIEITVSDFSRDISSDAFKGYKFPKGTKVSDRIRDKEYVLEEES